MRNEKTIHFIGSGERAAEAYQVAKDQTLERLKNELQAAAASNNESEIRRIAALIE